MLQASHVCKGCGQPIRGSYVSALGATWHPEHFVCGGCALPIADGQFTVHDGAPYHVACYTQQFAPRCVYCGKVLVGQYLRDYWGASFCKQHQRAYPACAYCGRLIPPQQQEAGREPGEDTRCPICRSRAVETAEEAKPYFAQVKQWVSRQGLVYNNLPLKLELCDPARLARQLQGRSQMHAHGATLSTTYTQDGRELYTKMEGVSILHGLPAVLFQGVAVHELGHVWLIAHDVKKLPLWAEEGFCQLLAYDWYIEMNTPESRYYAQNVEQHSDPVYGEGFRRVLGIARSVGLPRLIETLQKQKRLP